MKRALKAVLRQASRAVPARARLSARRLSRGREGRGGREERLRALPVQPADACVLHERIERHFEACDGTRWVDEGGGC